MANPSVAMANPSVAVVNACTTAVLSIVGGVNLPREFAETRARSADSSSVDGGRGVSPILNAGAGTLSNLHVT